MRTVDMLQAKSFLSHLEEIIEHGKEREIVIARNGRPVAGLVPIWATPAGNHLGVARGLMGYY